MNVGGRDDWWIQSGCPAKSYALCRPTWLFMGMEEEPNPFAPYVQVWAAWLSKQRLMETPPYASLVHLGSFHLDDLLIRGGIWGFCDLFFNGIIRWRLLWVDLGCEPADGETVLSCFITSTCARTLCFPVLNVVAHQSVEWTISFRSFLGWVNVSPPLICCGPRSLIPALGKTTSIPTFLRSCACVRQRSIRLVAGHFFHHVLGMCCITHMHKHSHLKFVVLLMESPFLYN